MGAMSEVTAASPRRSSRVFHKMRVQAQGRAHNRKKLKHTTHKRTRKKETQERAVKDRLAHVDLAQQVVVNPTKDSRKIDTAMEHLPALAADTPNPARGGSDGQRNQEHKSSETHGDERPLGDVFEHSRRVKRLVGPEIGEEVQGDVEECEEAEHAAKADEVRELEEFAERRNAKGEDEKAQRPISSGMLKSFDGISSEIAFDNAPDQIGERDQADDKDGDFGPFADKDCAHAECPP